MESVFGLCCRFSNDIVLGLEYLSVRAESLVSCSTAPVRVEPISSNKRNTELSSLLVGFKQDLHIRRKERKQDLC